MKGARKSRRFDLASYLGSSGPDRSVVEFPQGRTVFFQGKPADSIYYIRQGTVKLTTVSENGKEAVVALLNVGDFFGEGCLTGQTMRMATATAMQPTSLLVIQKKEMVRMLHEEHAFSDRFILHMLKRNVRIEEDLLDQVFNSTEKRLARALLLLASYGKEGRPEKVIPRISQQTLAEIIGTNRGRVNLFMNKFKKLGFIDYNGGLHINSSLLTVVLHD
jgi:CRP/FNR family transcriptional regulator, cyclic AMP receptor protein